MNHKRLKTLAEHLCTLDEDLYMDCWFNDCGTAACAIGHAALIAEFQDEGFRPLHDDVAYKEARGWDAVQLFFDLTFPQAFRLFWGTQYKSPSKGHFVKPSQVAERINALIEHSDA